MTSTPTKSGAPVYGNFEIEVVESSGARSLSVGTFKAQKALDIAEQILGRDLTDRCRGLYVGDGVTAEIRGTERSKAGPNVLRLARVKDR